MQFAQYCSLRDPAVVELENAVRIAAVRDVLITRPNFESRMPHVDQKRGHLLPRSVGGRFFAGSREQNDEIRMISVADEMLRAVDDEIAAGRDGRSLHSPQIRPRARLG